MGKYTKGRTDPAAKWLDSLPEEAQTAVVSGSCSMQKRPFRNEQLTVDEILRRLKDGDYEYSI